ncbi:hypothetical protein H6B10_17445, partial [Gemmiger formicilis]|nr:hypothetical protein [Gemmiger formicilis]
EEFCRAAGATGVVLTKLDGTPKGGCAVSVWENLGLPIRSRMRRSSFSLPALLLAAQISIGQSSLWAGTSGSR